MEIFPLDSSHGVDHVRLRRGRAVGGGLYRVANGSEWPQPPPPLNSGSGRCAVWREKSAGGGKEELGFEVYDHSKQLADVLRGCQGKYELRGKRRDDIIREF